MRRRFGAKRWLVAALLLCWTSATFAEEHGVEWEWTKREIRKIDRIEKKLEKKGSYWVWEEEGYIVRSNISQRFTAELCFYMDYFMDVFDDAFPMPKGSKINTKLHVYVHRTRMQYMAASGAPSWSGGVHIPRMYGSGWPTLEVHTFPWNEDKKGEIDFCADFNRSTLQHEGMHAIISMRAGRIEVPVFVNEGCATYFETWDLRVKRPTKKERQERFLRGFHMLEVVRKYEKEPDFKPSLAECMAWDHATWGAGSGSEIGLRYGLAETFVDFLLTERRWRKQFKEMMERIFYRRTALEDDEIEKLEPMWHEHIEELVESLKDKLPEPPAEETIMASPRSLEELKRRLAEQGIEVEIVTE